MLEMGGGVTEEATKTYEVIMLAGSAYYRLLLYPERR